MQGRVLIVAGSDSGGGAGIQADLKTVTCLGGYAATAITALTAQDTRAVHGIHEVPPDFLRLQMEVVLGDLGADAVKLGMLHRADIIEVVADVLRVHAPGVPVVADPVMVAKSGHSLLEESAFRALLARILPLARVLTPNLPEAERLLGRPIAGIAEMPAAARALLALGPQAVLLKGGHLQGDRLVDVLAGAGGITVFESERIRTSSTHGTGCTLASAIATGLAQGLGLEQAVARARAYVREAILRAPGLGGGHGPLGHGHTVRPFAVSS
ncbi:MAG: bifunctional hydroxymethylpyrimidine kinase/phosphomethylpyrimidine kinase [Alphaproteobacteria bacterium]|nr:bifunctional hydroxymethylpyrimidine kinase/phosphomethylpyrimidine kinase [Alphaproteobacteria bacterium]